MKMRRMRKTYYIISFWYGFIDGKRAFNNTYFYRTKRKP